MPFQRPQDSCADYEGSVSLMEKSKVLCTFSSFDHYSLSSSSCVGVRRCFFCVGALTVPLTRPLAVLKRFIGVFPSVISVDLRPSDCNSFTCVGKRSFA